MIELDELEPLIAMPSSPGNVVPVHETAGLATRQVCVGSSVNSSFEDVALVAAVLRGATLPEHLDLTLTPGSRQILDLLVRSGVYSDALASGARILEPACGPCIGMGQAPRVGRRVGANVQPKLPRPQRHPQRPGVPLLAGDGGGDRADG